MASPSADLPGNQPGNLADLRRMPRQFVENTGQWDPATRFISPGLQQMARFEDDAVALDLRSPDDHRGQDGVVLRLSFNSGTPVRPVGHIPADIRLAFLLGKERARWRSSVPVWRELWYPGIRDGVDIRFRDHEGVLEYDLILEPGADLADVAIRCQGAEGMEVNQSGDLVIRTAVGRLVQKAPLTRYERPDGVHEDVECRFRLLGPDRFGFELTTPRRGFRLVVDPGLVFGTYVGGSLFDQVRVCALDAQDRVYVAGFSRSTDFPATTGAYSTAYAQGSDMFIGRLSAAGDTLEWATFAGGSGNEDSQGMVVEPGGEVIVAGQTYSPNFPTTPGAFDETYNGNSDCVLLRLSIDGSSLVYSTFIGGSELDEPYEPALDLQGNVVVPGLTHSSDFPVTPGAYDTSPGGDADAFVLTLDPTGASVVASTLLGGIGNDTSRCAKVLASGDIVITGRTGSPDFPATAAQTIFAGVQDAFVARFDPTLTSLVGATFIGGSGFEYAYDMDVAGPDSVVITGFTQSADFPITPGAYSSTLGGAQDAYVMNVNTASWSPGWSTFIGGSDFDTAFSVVATGPDRVTVGGWSFSPDWPTTFGAYNSSLSAAGFGGANGVVFRIEASGSRLVYSTFIGGSTVDFVNSIALTSSGEVALAGRSYSNDFPTTPGAFDESFNDPVLPGMDGFVALLDILVPALELSQPGGAGGGLVVDIRNLSAGRTYHTIFSVEPCPGGPGNGPFLGLCASDPSVLIEQFLVPLGPTLFHFQASAGSLTWGPFPAPPVAVTFEGVCFDFTNQQLGGVSAVASLAVQ